MTRAVGELSPQARRALRADWLRQLARAAVWALLPTAALLGLWAVLARVVDVEVGDLTREATTVGGLPWYVGGLSAVAVGLWVAAAAVALVASSAGQWRREPAGELLLTVGLLSLTLALDDQYRVHEELLPRLGVPELVSYAGYALVGGVLVLRARRFLVARTDTAVLSLAVVLLGLSVLVDVVAGPLERVGFSEGGRIYLEDGVKTLGAAVWLRWTALVSRRPVAGP